MKRIIEIEEASPPSLPRSGRARGDVGRYPVVLSRRERARQCGIRGEILRFQPPRVPRERAVASATGASLIPMLFMFCDKASLQLESILRIRMGLFTKNDAESPHHNPHVDFAEPHYTAVYYVNDSDGDTFIFNETSFDLTTSAHGPGSEACRPRESSPSQNGLTRRRRAK